MRAVGEGGFGKLAQAKRCPRAMKKKNIVVRCECGEEGRTSEVVMKKFHRDGWRCFTCVMKKVKSDKREMQQAVIALAKRKGLI